MTLTATKLAQAGLSAPCCLPHSQRINSFRNKIGMHKKKWSEFGNNMFHLQIGTRNKTVLIYQFGNNVFHSRIGTRNKTVLIYQFGNNEFHLQIGTRNKTILIFFFLYFNNIY